MHPNGELDRRWAALPLAARVALEEQWAGVPTGGLPCGAAIADANGEIVASGRNRAYDPAGEIGTRARYPLQHNRLAHAELNALALLPTERDHAPLTVWSTQHPCAMCAAALAFVGIGRVCFIADDPSDDAPPVLGSATIAGVVHRPFGDPLWWTISNLLFLYNTARRDGERGRNIRKNRDRYPELVALALDLAGRDALREAAPPGISLPGALAAHYADLERVAARAPGPRP